MHPNQDYQFKKKIKKITSLTIRSSGLKSALVGSKFSVLLKAKTNSHTLQRTESETEIKY